MKHDSHLRCRGALVRALQKQLDLVWCASGEGRRDGIVGVDLKYSVRFMLTLEFLSAVISVEATTLTAFGYPPWACICMFEAVGGVRSYPLDALSSS